MSKRTLLLIVFLLILTGFFVYLAVSQRPVPPPASVNTMTPTKKPVPAYTTIMLSPQTLALSSVSGSLDVIIDTGTGAQKNAVTAVQLELQYDPASITNVTVTPGTFFPNASPLINTNNKTTGNITYALAIPVSGKATSGSGVVAKIQFQSLLTTGKSTTVSLLPQTLVTATGITESVLKSAKGATISVGKPAVIVSPAISTTP